MRLPLLLLLLPFASVCFGQAAAPTAPATVTAAPAPPAYESDPRFLNAFEDARQAQRKGLYSFEAEDYKKANKIAGGACLKCLSQLYRVQISTASYKAAAATAGQMAVIATTPLQKSLAEGQRGAALFRQAGDKPKPVQLEEAHAALQAALTDYPRNNFARYSDGCVLARMGKTDEAGKQFAVCADNASATDPMRVRARHFSANPSLSLEKMAPAFEVTALDGSRFNLDNMGGKVVLIDFWATWCGPCNAELPHIKKIAQEFAGQPLVIISVSWDEDEGKWKEFTQKNEMTWLQYRDADHSLSKLFGVQAIPHYFTIDSDGVLTAEMLGEGSDVEGKLKKLVKRAREAAATQTAATNEKEVLPASQH